MANAAKYLTGQLVVDVDPSDKRRLLHFPSGVMVGGMVAGFFVKGATLGELPNGDLLSVVSQLLVAYVIVSNSDVASLRAHSEAVPAALFYIALPIDLYAWLPAT